MHIEEIDLGQLRLVEALNKCGTLTAAAREIGLSQSAASHSLARLRRRVGDQIFVRIGSGMRPTPYGQQLGESVRHALTVMRRSLGRQSDFNPRTSTRSFNVCMSDVGQLMLLPNVIAYLESEAPSVTLRVWPVPVEQQSRIFESGEVDLAVGYFTTLNTGFRQKRLFSGHYVCVVRKEHPAFANGMTLEGFRSASHAVAESSGMGHAQLYRLLANRKQVPATKLVVPQFIALPQVLSKSDLVAIMPECAARLFAHHMYLRILPLPLKLPDFMIKLYWHDRYHHDPGIVWLREVFGRLFPSGTEG